MDRDKKPDTEKKLHQVYLSLGSNLGNRRQHIDDAIQAVGRHVGTVESVSSVLETEPWGYQSDNSYLNAAVKCSTTLTPHQLLRVTQRIEKQLGRTTKTRDGQYTDRPIDIDILLYDNCTVNTPRLTIPHPRMLERVFVMQPLSEIMPEEQYRKLTT